MVLVGAPRGEGSGRSWRTARTSGRCDQVFRRPSARCEIASGAWLETFSGKEIFRHIRSQVPWKFPFENDEDLAYKLAEEWRRTKSTPQFIDTLRDAIIDGSGL